MQLPLFNVNPTVLSPSPHHTPPHLFTSVQNDPRLEFCVLDCPEYARLRREVLMSSREKVLVRRRRILMGELPSGSESEEIKNDLRLIDMGEVGERRLLLLGGGLGGEILTRAYLGSGGQSYIR